MRTLLLACLIVGLVGAGCAGRKSDASRRVAKAKPEQKADPAGDKAKREKKAKPEPVAVVPSKALTGKVLRVDKNARFAVMAFPGSQMPAMEQKLSVYRDGLKVGEIKITGPQRDDKTVGDIIAGESNVGDQVSDR